MLQESVAYLEQTLSDTADKHWHEIRAHKAAHVKHDTAHGRDVKDLEGLRAAREKYASIKEQDYNVQNFYKNEGAFSNLREAVF